MITGRWFPFAAFFVAFISITQVAFGQQAQFFQITLDDAESALGNELIAEGLGEKINAQITSLRQETLYTGKEPLNVEVKTLKFDEAAKTFSANILFKAGENVMSALPVSGRYDESISVPVLTAKLKNGDVISESDVLLKDFPSKRVRADTITDMAELVGRTPRRAITNNRPIRKDEVQAPAMIKKGAAIQMSYKTEHMTVQTMGEAMEDGSEGARIRVKNQDSQTVVYATVLSEGEVAVGNQPAQLAAAVTANGQNMSGRHNGRQTR